MKVLKVLGISGSLKVASTNTGILHYMASQAPKVGIDMEIADLSEVPFFNPDTESDKPAAVNKFLEQLKDADAIVLATPEYNYSFTPVLKNALDWGSRAPGNELFQGKATALVSAGGGLKGSRSQYQIRQVGVFLDLHILNKPEVMFNAFDGTFDAEGSLISEDGQKRVVEQLEALKALSLQLSMEIA